MHPGLVLKVSLAALLTQAALTVTMADVKQPAFEAAPLIDPLHEFSSKLFAKTRSSQKNVILSPLSVHQALNLVLLGADSNTPTESELLGVLGYDAKSSKGQTDYHQAYKSINSAFRNITEQGKALRELHKNDELGRESNRKPKPTIIDTWNAVIAKNNEEFLPKYKQDVSSYYNSSVERVCDKEPAKKTEIVARVNRWAKEAGFESELLAKSTLDGDFSAILMSAIRVEASWFDQFHEYDEENMFYNLGQGDQLVKKGKVLKKSDLGVHLVEFAVDEKVRHKRHRESVAKKYPELNELSRWDFTAIQVTLEGKVQLTIFEPIDKSPEALNKLVDNLLVPAETGKRTRLARVLDILDSDEAYTKVDSLIFPKIKFDNELSLNDPLKAMGLLRAFDKNSAEISQMMHNKLYISDVKHNAMIDVDKNGLKAIAITTIRMMLLSAFHKPSPIEVHVKNPFLFMVRYEKLPLFMGQLVKV